MESRTSMMNWKPLDVDLTARAIPRAQLLAAADRHGLAYVNSAALGAAAGCSAKAAWRWLAGIRVAPATDAALRRALGLASEAA